MSSPPHLTRSSPARNPGQNPQQAHPPGIKRESLPPEFHDPAQGDLFSDVQQDSPATSVAAHPFHAANPQSTTHSFIENVMRGMHVDQANTISSQTAGVASPPFAGPSAAAAGQTAAHASGPNPFTSSLSRDALLAYAYHLYDTPGQLHSGMTSTPLINPLSVPTAPEDVYRLQLLPLLGTLRSLHPQDLAVLMLMACAYYALADFEASLAVSVEMLKIDPNSVEAMGNIGTTMKAMGRTDQAYEWWWKALQLYPTYWDATENMLSFLLSAAQSASTAEHSTLLYSRALDVCTFVQQKIVSSDGRLLLPVLPHELHRLQKIFFTSATLRMMHPSGTHEAVQHHFSGIEVVIRPPAPYSADEAYTTRELILAAFVAGYLVQSAADRAIPADIMESLGGPAGATTASLTAAQFDIFRAVRTSGDRILAALLRAGGNALPFLLLLPEQVSRLPTVLFNASKGVLPAICSRAHQSAELQPPSGSVIYQTNLMTSAIFLALAKRYQDLSSSDVLIPGFTDALNVNHSLAIMFYYLALSLNPSPSTYNNMGIVLSATSSTSTYSSERGERLPLIGATLARMYYVAGLQIDPNHPHLLTNLGSLYKDVGNLDEAIGLYMKAVAIKPDFDIALANLGNTVKDTGRSWEAIGYYRRAVELNPNLPEAVCGLVSSLAAVCDWRGRDALSGEFSVDSHGNIVPPGTANSHRPGYMKKMLDICEAQLEACYHQNIHCVRSANTLDGWLQSVELAAGRPLRPDERQRWRASIDQFYGHHHVGNGRRVNEAGFVIRFINWLLPRIQRRWYISMYGTTLSSESPVVTDPKAHEDTFLRPSLPRTMTPPTVPSILPFNTFIYSLPARTIRLISHRNALRISYTALSQAWLPKHVYPPPDVPLNGLLNIGYVSNDVNNHPLAHLMLSVFGLHDRKRFRVFVYTTSAWDGTSYRPKISSDVDMFVDASMWSTQQIVEHISQHKIHILINLGGYTKGARNDVFAARPCPVQLQLMGYAGTLGAGWCDYLVCDSTACPQDLSAGEVWRTRRTQDPNGDHQDLLEFDGEPDPEGPNDEWMFSEKFIYMPHTFMVTDHKQSFRTDEGLTPEERQRLLVAALWRNEERRRTEMRKQTFPDLPTDTIIFANFNQLYKIDPSVFALWLRILARVPKSILWLLRFPAAGEEHLRRTAVMWAGAEIAARIRFTDVAQKDVHVHRGRVADLFLDTIECNAHTIAADVLWPGTPILTLPRHRHKMCSRVAAGMAYATGFGDQMIVHSLQEYEDRAVGLAESVRYTSVTDSEVNGETVLHGRGELISLRRNLFLNRDRMPLFDTTRWTRNIEKAYWEAWRRWVEGIQFEASDEWEACSGPEKQSGCIWVVDEEPVDVIKYDDM